MNRTLGRSGIDVSAIGLGCWAIGGPHARNGNPVGWGVVNDEQSIAALRRGYELGCTFYDTADVYGCGHSEKILAEALGNVRDKIVIATKAGYTYNEETREAPGADGTPDYIRQCCEHSLRRLKTDYIDLYQFHLGGHPMEQAEAVRDVFDERVTAGKVRTIGWSTDDPERSEFFAQSPNCTAIQQAFNVFGGNEATLAVCEKYNLASVLRGPLGMGMLTGKFSSETKLADDDVRRGWNFKEGGQADRLKQVDALRQVLTEGGRSLAQGALCWLLARSPQMVPIPGFKTVEQVEENLGALQYGPLTPDQMDQVEQILGRAN